MENNIFWKEMGVAAVKAKLPGIRKNRNREALVISDVVTQGQFNQTISAGKIRSYCSSVLYYFTLLHIYSLWKETSLACFRRRQQIFVDLLTKTT